MRINRFIPPVAVGAAITAAVAALSASSSAAPVAHESASLTGAGSTLVQPMVENIFAPDFKSKSGTSVTYGGVGSGAGITDISKGTVDFGASDAPLTSAQAEECSKCIEIPWALAATGFSYNLQGVKEVKLSGNVIAEIYLGKITSWNDPKIKKLNKGVNLPNEKITPVYRSDGSGDTYVFTRYLATVNKEWRTKVGYGTSVSFPVGQGGKGNSGVAAIVASTPGAIGNNSAFYIRETNLGEVSVENNAGKFIRPFPGNVTAAATAMLKKVPSLNSLSPSSANSVASSLSLVDCPYSKPKKGAKLSALQKNQAQAYPLSTFTYVLVKPGSSNAGTLKQFIEFAITPTEEKKGAPLAFAQLPKSVEKADKAALASL